MKSTKSMITNLRGWRLLLCGLGVLLVAGSGLGAADFSEVRETGPIPSSYKSWSLLLVSNPEWLLDQKADQLEELYQQSKCFGKAIGRDHVAVWFWSEEIREGKPRPVVDLMRCTAICRNLKLSISEGPYVVVMTNYPGACLLSDPKSFSEGQINFFVMKLNGTDATTSARWLSQLAGKVLDEKFSELLAPSSRLAKIVNLIKAALLDLAKGTNVSFEAMGLKAELPSLAPPSNNPNN